jgi:hypothetical protein
VRPRKRFGFSEVEKSKIWSRWKSGQSLHEIRRTFDKPHSSIRCLLLPRGGIPPAARRRSRLSLNLAEREDISRGIASGLPLREIARRLDRAASTLSREISPNGGRPAYRAHAADEQQFWCLAARRPFIDCSESENIQHAIGADSNQLVSVHAEGDRV